MGRATRRGVFRLRTFRRGGRFRLGWKLLSVARCPILLHSRLRLNEMSRNLLQKDARTGFQMLRFRSFERQRSLLVTEHIQMDFVCILTSSDGKEARFRAEVCPGRVSSGAARRARRARSPGGTGGCARTRGRRSPGRARRGWRGQTAALGTLGPLPVACGTLRRVALKPRAQLWQQVALLEPGPCPCSRERGDASSAVRSGAGHRASTQQPPRRQPGLLYP